MQSARKNCSTGVHSPSTFGGVNDAATEADQQADTGTLSPLLELSADVPEPIVGPGKLAEAAAALAAGTGPVAIDAERASGYRYGQRCYLVQLRREGAGTFIVDPVPFTDLTPLDGAVADAEWVIHAANQDLPCLADVGLRPRRLFDTELAARLAGYQRVGLATMVELVLGRRLDKGPSSADWSQRPLAPALLRYAALDVEVLLQLRDHLEEVLREQDKWAWALEEFAAILSAPPAPPRLEPWRRTSGLHRVRTPRQLAAVRALWQARDTLAQERDIAPGRVLPDAAIVDAALVGPATVEDLVALPVYSGRSNRKRAGYWLAALRAAAELPAAELPRPAATPDGTPPPPHRWAERDPAAAARLARARAVLAKVAAEHRLPPENLVEPAVVRRLAWLPPEDRSPDGLAAALAERGARQWQVTLAAPGLAAAFADA